MTITSFSTRSAKTVFLASVLTITTITSAAGARIEPTANNDQAAKYSEIKDIQISERELTAEELLITNQQQPIVQPQNETPIPDDMIPWDEFWEIGQKIWKFIVDNKPVANVQHKHISVLPEVQPNWHAMENWKGPYGKMFEMKAINGLNNEVVRLRYRVVFNYGGTFQGKGQYLANVTVIPENVVVAWGFNLNSEIAVDDVVNTGTADEPVPGVMMELRWKMGSVLKHMQGVDSFFVKGNGEVQRMQDQH